MIFLSYKKNETVYVPLHLNLLLQKQNFSASFYDGKIDEELIKDLLEFAKNTNAQYFLIDFYRINQNDSRIFTKLKLYLHNQDKHFILINLIHKIADVIFKVDCLKYALQSKVQSSIGLFVLSDNEGLTYFENEFGQNYNLKVMHFLESEIANCLDNSSIERKEYLESSNLYSNKYINIKNIFHNIDLFYLCIYLLCDKIVDNIDLKSCDGFISASINGAIIANAVARYLKKKVVYLRNLGPNLTIKDRELIYKIQSNKKYIFIFDFICTGSELKLADTIVTLRDSEIIHAAGISRFLDISRKNPKAENYMLSIVKINDHFDFKYEISAL